MTEKLKGAAVLFDLDGTLIDTAEDLAASMNHALAGDGFAAVPTGEVRNLVGHGARRMLMRGYEIAAGRDAGEEELDAALDRFLEHYRANIAVHSRPFEGAIGMIERLRADGAAIAICTNKREAMAVLLMDELGLSALFETIVGADTAAHAKPDPAPVKLCLERTGARRAAFIGDSDTDIRAARASGLPVFIADFGYGPLTLLDKATGAFSAYEELEETLRLALVGA